MDKIDLQILEILQKDGRTPFTIVAKQTGVSESTIRTRYASLIKRGIVQTVAVVDPFSMGYNAPALIGITTESGAIDSVAQTLEQIPEVSYLVLILGAYDLVIEVYCRDRDHLTDIIINQIQSIPGIQSTETLVIGKIFKLSFSWQPQINPQAK